MPLSPSHTTEYTCSVPRRFRLFINVSCVKSRCFAIVALVIYRQIPSDCAFRLSLCSWLTLPVIRAYKGTRTDTTLALYKIRIMRGTQKGTQGRVNLVSLNFFMTCTWHQVKFNLHSILDIYYIQVFLIIQSFQLRGLEYHFLILNDYQARNISHQSYENRPHQYQHLAHQ